jgi:hypothetical protein
MLDVRATRAASSRLPQHANVAAGTAAACRILIAVVSDLPAAITIFGAWAIAAGGIQLILAVRRRRTLGGQWLMIISGAGPVFAGTTFIGWAGSAKTGLSVLAQYSAGGAHIWYVMSAIWLLHPIGSFAAPSRQAGAGV